MDNMIEITGSREDVINAAVAAGIPSIEVAAVCLNVLCENMDVLPEGEVIEYTEAVEKQGEGAAGFMVGRGKYYVKISLHSSMFAMLVASNALLALAGPDTKMTIAAFLLNSGYLYFNNIASNDKRLINCFRLEESLGEKCILVEYAKLKRPQEPGDIKKVIGKKCMKDYECRFKKLGKCTCNKEKIEVISRTLCEKGALEPNGTGFKYVL